MHSCIYCFCEFRFRFNKCTAGTLTCGITDWILLQICKQTAELVLNNVLAKTCFNVATPAIQQRPKPTLLSNYQIDRSKTFQDQKRSLKHTCFNGGAIKNSFISLKKAMILLIGYFCKPTKHQLQQKTYFLIMFIQGCAYTVFIIPIHVFLHFT